MQSSLQEGFGEAKPPRILLFAGVVPALPARHPQIKEVARGRAPGNPTLHMPYLQEAFVDLAWRDSSETIDWEELSNLYRIAPLGNKKAADLAISFGNSRFVCFVFDATILVGAGRALADGIDCSYICDVAVHPEYQGYGIGKGIMSRLIECSRGHRKIILYSVPGKEPFYYKLGFRRMTTAMAIFQDQAWARENGVIEDE